MGDNNKSAVRTHLWQQQSQVKKIINAKRISHLTLSDRIYNWRCWDFHANAWRIEGDDAKINFVNLERTQVLTRLSEGGFAENVTTEWNSVFRTWEIASSVAMKLKSLMIRGLAFDSERAEKLLNFCEVGTDYKYLN